MTDENNVKSTISVVDAARVVEGRMRDFREKIYSESLSYDEKKYADTLVNGFERFSNQIIEKLFNGVGDENNG